MEVLKLCIIKPNKSRYSETFIQTHIDCLSGEKEILYGGNFPLYQANGKRLISKWVDMFRYLFDKRILKKHEIAVRNSALTAYLLKKNIQVVLAEYGTVGASITNACVSARVPLVIHFHGVDAHRYSLIDAFKDRYRAAFKYASALIVVSKDMRNSLIHLGADAQKVHLIPYGVNASFFRQIVLSSNIHFLSVGRFVEKKAPMITVQAFAQVVEKFPAAHLFMVGDGPLLEKVKTQAKNLGLERHITFKGILKPEEIRALMNDSYCYVQHSVTARDGDMEGTPNTILEASAAGLPIVSTRHAGIKEAIVENVTGYLVDEYDVSAMAQKMTELAFNRDLAERMGAAGRQHILEHYDAKQQINKLDSVLRQASKVQ